MSSILISHAAVCYDCEAYTDSAVLVLRRTSGGGGNDDYVCAGDFSNVWVCSDRIKCAQNKQEAINQSRRARICQICKKQIEYKKQEAAAVLKEHALTHTAEEYFNADCVYDGGEFWL